jgi:phosphatidylethanolamine/phosphatidyl-N-methylethanolamine N-methyltransferase
MRPASAEAYSRIADGSPARRAGTVRTLARRGYRAFAPFYDAIFGASLHAGRRLAVQSLDVHPGERVLEVCVGTGFALPLYPSGARVTGIDLSGDMLRRATTRKEKLGLAHVEALLQMDAERLAFATGSFDKVAMLFALCGLPNPIKAVQEMRRVCRPGGTIVIANHFRTDDALLRACEKALSPVYRLLQYRADLDLDSLVDATRLDVRDVRRTNWFNYATVVVCTNADAMAGASPAMRERH